ncbi:MAG TPA: hypothetical protein VLC09_18365 [Polyangiaceae bacterium]|nr:hypothetical protein [Polyangiaceae bacterium]
MRWAIEGLELLLLAGAGWAWLAALRALSLSTELRAALLFLLGASAVAAASRLAAGPAARGRKA